MLDFPTHRQVFQWDDYSFLISRQLRSTFLPLSMAVMGARTVPWATEVRSNTAPNNQPRWLDFGGALQETDSWVLLSSKNWLIADMFGT
ncbi:MAG: hypothetical protein ACRENT_00410, partial [Thermodesulfobacteriota bacterium]